MSPDISLTSTVEYRADNGSPLGNDNGNGDLAWRCPKGGGPVHQLKMLYSDDFSHNNCLFSHFWRKVDPLI